MTTKKDPITLYAVGDVGPDRADPGSIFRHVTDVIKQGDIAFLQLEVNLSKRGIENHENARDPAIAGAIAKTGFNVVSFAGNHCLDAGLEAFLDTLNNLKKQNLYVIGAGTNILEARQPAVLDCKGARISFLAYNSVLHKGYWAEEDKPGCAPLRAHTVYEPIEPDQPGTPARIRSFPEQNDLEEMVKDVKKAKSKSDLVVVSMHSGVHFAPAIIAEYQKALAYAAIDAGADLVLQHHAHILKGIEVYHGKVIFYSLSNFALELKIVNEAHAQSPRFLEMSKSLNPDWKPPYPDYPTFPFPPDSRKTILVKCTIVDRKIIRVAFLPAIINNNAEPELLKSQDSRFTEIVKYMEEITKSQNLKTKYRIEGDDVVVVGG